MKILIGCPVYKRAFILPAWFKFIEAQTFPLEDLGFIFELGPDDDETHDVLWEWHQHHPEVSVFDGIVREDSHHATHPPNGRNWNHDKYVRMVNFRNNLLDRVICYQPETFFSLDSDILLENPNTLNHFYEMIQDGVHAISPLTYMRMDDTDYPSMMTWVDRPGARAVRELIIYRDLIEQRRMIQSDIIMAAVMMSKELYNEVRYLWHPQGEDLGWCADATRLGYKLYCDTGHYSAHVMHEFSLPEYLIHGDSRSTNGSNRIILTPVN